MSDCGQCNQDGCSQGECDQGQCSQGGCGSSAVSPDEAQKMMQEQMLQHRMQHIGCKLLVLSGKGGVGKSTVAVNLAVALAAAGKKVGLLDVDVHGPSVPKLLGLEGRQLSMTNGEILPVEVNENLSVVSIGFLLQNNTDAVIWRGPRKFGAIQQFLSDVAWGRLDCLVVDSPPGTGDEPLAVAQLVGSPAKAVIVTTPQDLAISDVRRCVSFCNTLSLPVAGIVENMSGFVCPKCGERIDLFKSGGGKVLAEEMDVAFLGQIPIDPEVVTAGDSGVAYIASRSENPAALAFADVVSLILEEPDNETDNASQSKENSIMRIAIPLTGGNLSSHFGHCEQFAIVEVDEAAKTITNKTLETPPPHEPGAFPRWLHELGVGIIIAGGIGSRAQGLFAENDIQVVAGAPADTAENLVNAYIAGQLVVGDNVCDH